MENVENKEENYLQLKRTVTEINIEWMILTAHVDDSGEKVNKLEGRRTEIL